MAATESPIGIVAYLLSWCILVASCASSKPRPAGSTLTAKQLLSAIAQGKPLAYKDLTIEGDVDFTRLEAAQLTPNNSVVSIAAPLYFERCQFKGKVIGFAHRGDTAHTVRFGSAVAFQNCRFEGELDLRGGTFDHHLYLNASLFDRQANLQALRVGGDLRMENAQFSGDLLLQEAVVRGSFWAKEASVLGQFSAQQSDFWQHAVFAGFAVRGYADFGIAHFRRSAFFEYGNYGGKVNYGGAVFRHRAEWTNADFEQGADFRDAWFAFRPVFSQAANQPAVDLTDARFDGGRPETDTH